MLDYKKMTIQDMIEWSKGNKEAIAWLKANAHKKVEVKVYPKDENGKPDKSQEPTIKESEITFMQFKKEFAQKFMPEILPKSSSKKDTFRDLIDAL